tara:strand:+ start:284 stop:700 length:417 start_codon:yes stop_codon:yes gene_type:complete
MPLYVYMISHDKPEIKTHTYIGCTENFLKRLNQHNGLENGGPRITKRAAGSWKPVIILKIENKDIKPKQIKKEWKQSSRGLESRIRKGLELAIKNKLTIVLPKNINSNIPSLKYLNERWDGDKITMTDNEWSALFSKF